MKTVHFNIIILSDNLFRRRNHLSLRMVFKSHSTSINERFSKLKYCLQSRPKIQRNIFPPFGNELLPPSKTISLTGCPILYPLKQKDLCDYYPIYFMSIGLMFDEIIMDIIRNKKLECHNKEYIKKYL